MMYINWLLIPAILGAMLTFELGLFLVTKIQGWDSRFTIIFMGIVTFLPAISFSLYYFHILEYEWYYSFRTIENIEVVVAGLGLLPGIIVGLFRKPKALPHLILITLVAGWAFIPFVKPFIGPIQDSAWADRWVDDVCLQTTPSTCGVASAATLMNSTGLKTNEQLLAKECFTYRRGTEVWYIARALRRRGFNTQYKFIHNFSSNLPYPSIAGVIIADGVGHFIPIIEKKEGKYLVGDPIVGLSTHAQERILKDFRFTGFFMEVMKKSSVTK